MLIRGRIYDGPAQHGVPEAEPIGRFDSPVFQEKNRAQTYRKRLQRGESVCYGFIADGSVVAYYWL